MPVMVAAAGSRRGGPLRRARKRRARRRRSQSVGRRLVDGEAAERGAVAACASTGERSSARSRCRAVLDHRLRERSGGSMDPGARRNRAGPARARSAAKRAARGGGAGRDPARGRSLAGGGVATRQRSDPRRRRGRRLLSALAPAHDGGAAGGPRRGRAPPVDPVGRVRRSVAGERKYCLGFPAADPVRRADGESRPPAARLAATGRRRDARCRRRRRRCWGDQRSPAVARPRAAVVEPRVLALVLDRRLRRDVAREHRARQRGRAALPGRPRGAGGVGTVARLERLACGARPKDPRATTLSPSCPGWDGARRCSCDRAPDPTSGSRSRYRCCSRPRSDSSPSSTQLERGDREHRAAGGAGRFRRSRDRRGPGRDHWRAPSGAGASPRAPPRRRPPRAARAPAWPNAREWTWLPVRASTVFSPGTCARSRYAGWRRPRRSLMTARGWWW